MFGLFSKKYGWTPKLVLFLLFPFKPTSTKGSLQKRTQILSLRDRARGLASAEAAEAVEAEAADASDHKGKGFGVRWFHQGPN